MEKTENKNLLDLKDKILLVLLATVPIIGSFSTGLILCLFIFLSIYNLNYKQEWSSCVKTKIIGLIFILYFSYYAIHGLFFTNGISQHIHDLGKIFPIFIVGVFALIIRNNTFSFSYINISNMAVWGIYSTILLGLIFLFLEPNIIIFGEKLANKTGVVGRLEMGTGNPLPFATIFLTFALLSVLSIDKKNTFGKIQSLIAFLLAVSAIIIWNGSRGPILVIFALAPLVFWYLVGLSKHKGKKVYTLAIISIFLSILLLIYFISVSNIANLGYNVVSNMVNGIKQLFLEGEFDHSVSIRLTLYSASFKAFYSEPFLGYGIGNVFEAIKPHFPIGISFNYSHLHNMFLNHIVAGGLISLPFLFALVLSPLTVFRATKKKISRETVYMALIIALVICGTGMSNVLFFHDLLAGFFSILILLSIIALNNENRI